MNRRRGRRKRRRRLRKKRRRRRKKKRKRRRRRRKRGRRTASFISFLFMKKDLLRNAIIPKYENMVTILSSHEVFLSTTLILIYPSHL